MSDSIFSKEDRETNSSPQGLNILPLMRTVKRKALLITCITALATVLYTYIDSKQNSSEQYAGNFQLLVEPLTLEAKLSSPTTLTNPKGVPNEKLLAVDYPTIVRILTSTDILSDITEKVRQKYTDFSVSQLSENLQVARITDGKGRFDSSKLIGITYVEEDPELVQLVLEETARQYIDYSLTNRLQEIGSGLEFIEQQLPELNRDVTRNLNEIQQLQERYQMFQADTKSESLLQELQETRAQQAETAKEIEEQTRVTSNLQTQLNISVNEAIAILSLRENPNYQELMKRLKDKESELALASATFSSNSPQYINLQAEKQELLDLLAIETREILGRTTLSAKASRFLISNDRDSLLLSLVEQLVATANSLEGLQARQQNLARSASTLEQQVNQFPEVLRRYKQLQQEVERANETREQLLVQKDRLEVQASQTKAPWSVVAQPEIERDSDGNPVPLPVDVKSRILKGLAIGLLLGVGTAILLERNSDRFYTTDDVMDAIKSSPILGEIPYNEDLSKLQSYDSLKQLSLSPSGGYLSRIGQVDNIYSDFLNAFDKLYANIYLRYRYESIRSIAICSPTRGDGRSTVALYLAKQIAARGKKVLLVDENSFNYQLPDELVSVEQAEENLFVLIASQKVLNHSKQREKLMSEFKENYDYVIYDTPPLLNSVTAGLLSVDTDGILMVTAIGKTSRSSFREAFKQVETFKLPLLGIVTNDLGSIELQENTLQKFKGWENSKLFDSPEKENILNAEVSSQSEEDTENHANESHANNNNSTINPKA